ncbi:hypothetical protein ANANG_G00128110 [Anguilla anguilla]|uniref:Uncharacterized protein n=1 Tax=Anguilla anguilla TaxID=7936 RepID=A0A9D3MEQ7_ANGAN|nr:hypothetical protein ANANG_G00128110 [Anguilla anguilla]
MFHRSEEDLVKDVVSLRNQLRQTEISLQSLGEQLSGSSSEHSDHSPGCVQPGGLTLEDLRRPDVTQPPPISPILPETSLRIATGNVPHADYRPPSVTEIENSQLRKTLGSIREENSCLVLENQKLANELEEVQFRLAGSHAKVMGTTADSKPPSLSLMKEHIQGLEAEVESRTTALRDSEQKLEERQHCVLMNSRMVTKLKQELKTVQADLAHRISQGKRMEQQRNEALRNAEKLTAAFKEYKGNISEKMTKVLENEMKLKESLIECDREREELESRCSKLERERAEMARIVRQLKEDSCKTQALSTENTDLRSLAESSSAEASRLQQELADSKAAAEALKRENADLRSFSTSQEQRLALCLREGEQTRAELASLEAILNVLHLREGGGVLCVQPCILPQVSLSGYSDFRNAKPGERYAQLLPALQALEQERSRQAGLASGLQEQLSRAREELAALQSSMSQRASHFQHIHSELLEKAGEASRTEREGGRGTVGKELGRSQLRKKTARVGALEKQLQEKASAYSAAAVKNCELEQILLDKTSSLQHTEALFSRKQKDFQQALEKSKKAYAEKCKQLQEQMELLQQSLDQKKAQVQELEKRVSLSQKERKEAQQKCEQLQASWPRSNRRRSWVPPRTRGR